MMDSVVMSWFGLFFISNCFVCSNCYDAIDYEIFDLVEEVNKNFYDIFGIDSVIIDIDLNMCCPLRLQLVQTSL